MKTARKPKPPKPREAEIQKTAIAVLEAMGWRVFRRNVGATSGSHNGKRWFVRFASPGQSDLWGLMPPPPGDRWWRPFEAECKRPGERPALAQVRWLMAMNEITGSAFWFDSLDILERVARCLAAGGYVEYVPTHRKYGESEGPSGDYDIVYPDNL
jgi:hypothetical protein